MKTWAKQLEDALPNASQDVIDSIMDYFCPYDVLGNELAPEYLSNEPCYVELCAECWDSCESVCKCRKR